jgi:poly [ADP-ribose] polymerase
LTIIPLPDSRPLAQHERLNAEFEALEKCVKKNKQSTWGVGRFAPDEAGTTKLEGGTVAVPMGKAQESSYLAQHLTRLMEAEGGANPALLYNEYIVYDVRQIKMKYVVLCELES